MQRYGEKFLQVMQPTLEVGMEPALLVIDGVRLPCKVRLQAKLSLPPFATDYVALGVPSQYVVVSSSGFTMAEHEVDLLLIGRHRPTPDRT